MLKWMSLPCFSLLLVLFVASTAAALPLNLTIDEGSSSASLAVSSPYPSAARPLSPSGVGSGEALLGDHVRHGQYVASFSSDGVDLTLGGATLTLDTPAGIELTFEASNLGATLAIPELFTLAVAPGRSLFDLVGSSLQIDRGMLRGTGSQLGNPVAFEWDFAEEPLSFLFPADSLGTAQITSVGGDPFAARFDLPLDLQTSFFAGPTATEFRFDLRGTAVVNATLVPEPSTALLVAFGLAILAGTGRRGRSDVGA